MNAELEQVDRVGGEVRAVGSRAVLEPEPEPPGKGHSPRYVILTVFAILAVGLAALIVNADLPVVRNSLLYASTVGHLQANANDPLAVIADERLSYGKPVAFPFLALPLVRAFGLNAGLEATSYLGTAFFLFAAWFFFARLNRRVGLDQRAVPLELGLLFFNPLVIYQFWSAYPDGLFAGQVLLACALTDRIVSEHRKADSVYVVLLGFVIYFAILTKLYGLILGLACPVYMLFSWRSWLRPWRQTWPKMVTVAAVFGMLGWAVVLARKGANPTIDFVAGHMPRLYSVGTAELSVGLGKLSPGMLLGVAGTILFALVLSFNFSLLFLVNRRPLAGWPAAATGFMAVYLLGLVPFGEDTYDNLRYFMPAFGFVVLGIVRGFRNVRSASVRGGVVTAYVGVTTLLTLNYNARPVYEAIEPTNQRIEEVFKAPLENLRMADHLRLGRLLSTANATLEPGASLLWVSYYYGDASHVIARDRLRPDIELLFPEAARDVRIPPAEPRAYLAEWYQRYSMVESLRTAHVVTALAPGLSRLERRLVLREPAPDNSFAPGAEVRFQADVNRSEGESVARVDFQVDGRTVAVVSQPPYAATWTAEPGRHSSRATVHYVGGSSVRSPARTLFVGVRGFERSIARSEDDAEELLQTGDVSLESSDLELIMDSHWGNQVVGLRFTDMTIPAGSRVRSAWLQFTTDHRSVEPAELTLRAELSASAAPFEGRDRALQSRRETEMAIRWSPAPWSSRGERGEAQRSPDLATLLQEVVALPDWRPGNPVVFLIRGKGQRRAVAFDNARDRSVPSLYVELEPSAE